MTFSGDILRNHHRITLSVTVHSRGDTTVTASLVFVIVLCHRVLGQLSCESVTDDLVWSQNDIHVHVPKLCFLKKIMS